LKEIYFYSRDDEYGWLSNFYRAKQVCDDLEYPTNEHFYQSAKTVDRDLKEWIRTCPLPYYAMKVGRLIREKDGRVNLTDEYRINTMRTGLMAKFTQNPDLKAKLLATGHAILHENSENDLFWGKNGRDMLGILLMEVREWIRTAETV
jgi:N-glycosidase YbiA